MTLGKRLAATRGKISQKDFGALHGVSQRTYARYERDEDAPDAVFLASICSKHDINPTWLLLGEGSMHINEVARWAAPLADIDSWAAPPSPVLDLVREIVIIVEKLMQEHDLDLPPEKMGDLVALLFEEFAEKKGQNREVPKGKILRLIRALAV